MRGLWDHEQPLSPGMLRSALALAGGLLAALAVALVALGVASATTRGLYLVALLQLAAGLSLPFAAWVGLKMLADILTVLNRSHDRLDALEERLGYAAAPSRRLAPSEPREIRASDDGPSYPEE